MIDSYISISYNIIYIVIWSTTEVIMKKHIVWLLVIVLAFSSMLLLVGCDSEDVELDGIEFRDTFETTIELEGYEDEMVLQHNVANSILGSVFAFDDSWVVASTAYDFEVTDLEGNLLENNEVELVSGDNFFIVRILINSVSTTTTVDDNGDTVTEDVIVSSLDSTQLINVHVLENVTVTYYVGETVYYTETVMEGEAPTAPEVDPTEDDNEFVSWVDEEGDDINFKTYEVFGNTSFYASWTENLVVLDLDGGSVVGETSFIVSNDTILGDDLAVPTKDGMVFSGWCDDDGVFFDIYTEEIFYDLTLVAQWTEYKWTYELLEDETISIVYDDTNSGDIVVPTVINGYEVSALGKNAFNGFDGITSITIGDHITSIGSWAFAGCTSLTDIEIPNSVESIGAYGFFDCSGLTNVYIPSGVTSIGNWCFANCSSLTAVDISDTVSTMGSYVFKYCDDELVISVEAASAPSNWASAWNSYGGTASYSQEIANTLVLDFNGGTSDFDTLSVVEYGFDMSTVTVTLDGYVLSGWCYENGKLFNHNTTTVTSDIALVAQWSLYAWTYEELSDGTLSLTYVGDNSGSVVVPSTLNGCAVSALSADAFVGFDKVTSITIPDSIKSIGTGAFVGCDSLTMTKSDNAYYMGTSSNPYMFLVTCVDTTITSCVIHEDTVVIGDGAFSGCLDLTSLIIVESVTTIGDGAFANSGLTSIVIPDSVTTIGTGILAGCDSIASVTVPFVGSVANGDITYFGYLFGADSYEAQGSVIPSSLTFVELTSLTKLQDFAFYGCSSLVEIVLPDTLSNSYFGDSVFENCTSLTTITLPDSISTIRQYTFAGCTSLVSFEIGEEVTTIEAYAFTGSGLTSIVITESIKTIYEGTFADCEDLASVTMGSAVTTIGVDAFANCTSLTTITISSSVTKIGMGAFDGCTGLVTVVFETEDDDTTVWYETDSSGYSNGTVVATADAAALVGATDMYWYKAEPPVADDTTTD